MPVLDNNDDCPHCGHRLPVNASRCRNCGASDEYGWDSVESNIDDLGADYAEEQYGADDFDYDDFVAREFPEHAEVAPSSSRGPSMAARLVILALLASLIMTFVFM